MPALPPPGTERVLFLIDLSGYVFRAYHAIAPLSSSRGEPTHAVLGTVNMLQKVVNERKPHMLAVAMDSRIEFYPPEVWHDYAGVLAGSDGWEQRIASWAPTIAVIAKRDQPIVDRFTGLGWRSVYSDADGSILLAPGR
jgi:hypothetical protein